MLLAFLSTHHNRSLPHWPHPSIRVNGNHDDCSVKPAAILETQAKVTVLHKENLELRNQISSMDGKLDSLLQLLTSFITVKGVDLVSHESVVSSPITTGKRRRISAESDNSSSADSTEESTNAPTDSSAESTEDSANSPTASAPTGGRVATASSVLAASAPTKERVATASSGFFAPRPSSHRHSTAKAKGMSTAYDYCKVT